RHPLYVGAQLREMGPLGKPDVLINMGSRFGERAAPGTTLISIRRDPTSLARNVPVDLGMVADLRLRRARPVAAVQSKSPAGRPSARGGCWLRRGRCGGPATASPARTPPGCR